MCFSSLNPPTADRFEDMYFGTNFPHTSMNAYIYVLLIIHVSAYDYITKNGTNRQGLNLEDEQEGMVGTSVSITAKNCFDRSGFCKNEGVSGLFVLVSDSTRFTPFLTLSWITKEESAINSLGCFLMSQQKKVPYVSTFFLLLLLLILEFFRDKKARKTRFIRIILSRRATKTCIKATANAIKDLSSAKQKRSAHSTREENKWKNTTIRSFVMP